MKLIHFIKRRFLRLPALLALAVILGPLAGASAAYGSIIYPLPNYRIRFDLGDSVARPPYTYVLAYMNFDGLDPFGAGDGFTAQLFDSSNHAASSPLTYAYQGPDVRNLAFDFSIYAPLADDEGYIQFSDFSGSFALEVDQYILASNGVSATGFVRGSNENFIFRPVPEPATFGLFGGLGALGLAVRRMWRQKSRHIQQAEPEGQILSV